MNRLVLWKPSSEDITKSNLYDFLAWLERNNQVSINEYPTLYNWSIYNSADFWNAVWDYCGVIGDKGGKQVIVDADHMIDTQWFPDARLNYAENLLHERGDKVAIIARLESGERASLSYRELYSKVARLAHSLRDMDVQVGNRIAAFMPNTIETIVATLATASIGAIWTSCSPEFGINGVLDRFGQTQPKVLIACDGYYFNGKTIDTLPLVKQLCERIDSIQQLILVPVVHCNNHETLDLSGLADVSSSLFNAVLESNTAEQIKFERLPFDHPLYILYSSGTTGVPKCIVHGAGGTLLQHLKEHRLHVDLKSEDHLFYFTTCGWMMWNWLVSGLATSATLILYDGSPFYPEPDTLIDMIDAEDISIFGTSAKYIAALEKAGIKPRESHKLTYLSTILSTGSPLSVESFEYVYRDIKENVCLSSISGGTDIISCFALGNTTLPVYRGEIQCRGLGMAVDILDDQGKLIRQQKGELVCTQPFPSMPIGFWNDPDKQKYRRAYFDIYDNVWAHGDYAEITKHGGMIIHGRSDSMLNPCGVRIGTAEIYRHVEKIPEVLDSICIGQDWQDDVRVVLFVVLREGTELNDELKQKIKQTIRTETTPRHVPDKILQARDIPRTFSGKIVELAVRNIVHNRPLKNIDALANPESLKQFKNIPELQE